MAVRDSSEPHRAHDRTGTRPIGVGVLGAADIAWRNALPAVQRCDELRLVAVASRSAGKAGRFADRFGCEAVDSYSRLLERDDVEAVYVPLPNALHEEWAEAALRAGKHVLVEKSLTVDAEAARRLAGLAEARGLAFMENFTFLCHPQHDEVRKLVADGAIGTPQTFTASLGIPRGGGDLIRYRPELAGGTLRENGCYPLRAALLHLGDDLRVLGAHLRTDPATGVDVAGSALLADGAGLTAQCDFGLEHSYRNTYALWGSEGRVELDWAFNPRPETRPVLRLQRGDVREERVLAAADQFQLTFAAFAAACREPVAHRHHAQDAVRQATVMEAVLRAATR
ncbi:Gfo/Idh/MocA family oxidoreductase [Streptomyces sp. RKND-216]|uniref:Gfo/Idh/MocA family protein n=1 Tax=Streptomyces sp. RKND-216 TaxID=2562581 RepID=UPI00109E267F|nr:Gfo/Idh/MocA family oxidoreductase [Streptomyces sp. RKND-216]THA26365.1 Gfo/Idh/MocA family oxidoreductase [Streptomyces sp. RKND-216]